MALTRSSGAELALRAEWSAVAEEPLTLQEAKIHLRLDGDDFDDYLSSIITEARSYVEDYSGYSLVPQTRTAVVYDDLRPAGALSGPIGRRAPIRLPYPPITAVVKVEAYDALNNEWTELTAESDYFYDAAAREVRVTSYPLTLMGYTNAHRVTYTCGYADRASVPTTFKRAMTRYVSWAFNQPGGSDPPDLHISRKVTL